MALTHEPIGKPGGPGVWGTGKQYPAYFQHIRNDLMQAGHPEAEAHSLAWGILRNFAAGHDGKGNKVSADTQAKAVACLAQMRRLQAEAKATRSTAMSDYDADGLDASWDGDHGDLPDLTGLGVPEFEAAETELGWTPGDGGTDSASRAAKLGTGARFAALKSSLAAKGATNPGALAAWIGRRKYGKGRFGKLSSAARRRKGGPALARAGELFRTYPLEVCEIDRNDSSGRVVEAYAAMFDTPAEIRDHEGEYTETIDKGAFNRRLDHLQRSRAGFAQVVALYNHALTVHGTPAERFSLPIGVPLDIRAEGLGLLTRTRYAKTPLGDEILQLVTEGAISAQSFTGRIVRSDPTLRPGEKHRLIAGRRTLVRRLELGLREYGPTPFPAYSGAEILGVRMSLPGDFDQYDDESYHDEAPPPDGEPAAGGSADEGHPSRSLANRSFRLSLQEQAARAGITLTPKKGD